MVAFCSSAGCAVEVAVSVLAAVDIIAMLVGVVVTEPAGEVAALAGEVAGEASAVMNVPVVVTDKSCCSG